MLFVYTIEYDNISTMNSNLYYFDDRSRDKREFDL